MTNNNQVVIVPPPAQASSVALTNDIRPVKPPVPIPSGWAWAWWLAGVLAAAALALVVVRWLRKRAQPPLIPPVPPHIRARHKLAEALRLIAEPKPFCIAVSDALRIYLEERFDFRAPERTTEEFLIELQGTSLLTPGQKESVGEFLQSCDLVKFAQFEPTEQALRELHESALRLVDETQYLERTAAAPAAPPGPPTAKVAAGPPPLPAPVARADGGPEA